MLKLTIDSKVFLSQINEKIDAVKELASPKTMQEVSKAAFSITGRKFVLAVDRYAALNPKRMHHVYEWNRIGDPLARLFVIERSSILNGDLVISSSFLPSRVPVPVPAELRTAGPTGKMVTSNNIFRNKADVMERGQPVTFDTIRIITFLGSQGQMFFQPGTRVTINNPGGIQTRDAFRDFMVEWYTENVQSVMDSSGLYETIVDEASKIINTGNGGVTQVRKAVQSIVNSAIGSEETII